MRLFRLSSASLTAALGTAACGTFDQQSVLDPAGPQAASVHRLWYVMLAIAVAVYVVVVGAMAVVAKRRRQGAERPADDASVRRWVSIATAVTVVLLFIVLSYDLALTRTLRMPPAPMLSIRVTGHQWWWEVEYEDPVPQNRVRSANEIHIPVGQPVMLKLESHDVIHSLWIPNLAGKKDLIPGHHNEQWIRADRPGTFRAQCAEFCGLQHAKMSLFVIAEPPDQFAQWLASQRATARPPADSVSAHGLAVFETGPCALCHTIASTRAAGKLGPDLTHVASRSSLAAGTLTNTRANLAGWILDPQTIKPGAQMPVNALAPADLRALVAYMETLR